MQVSVTVTNQELKRLICKSIGGKVFSRKVIQEIAYRLLDRVERDYPDMLKPLYESASRRYQNDLAKQIKMQRNNQLRKLDGEFYE